MIRAVVDLDGTICPLKEKNQSYEDLVPHPGAVERLREMKANGFYIIIQTARNMATQQANLGKVMKNIGKVTLDWLERYEVPYDEIYFGKPNGHVYIDDRALRFSDWSKVTTEHLREIAQER
ncbi:MAG: hypothetical protein ACPF9D_10140 [Owenweeksia sp.]